MKYINQNPQVTALLEKIEEQEKVIRHWQGICANLQQKLDMVNEQVKLFNKLPWYEKIIFKF